MDVFSFSGSIVATVGDAQVFADASGKKFLYIAMYGYDAAGSCLCIAIEGVRPFVMPNTVAVVSFQVL